MIRKHLTAGAAALMMGLAVATGGTASAQQPAANQAASLPKTATGDGSEYVATCLQSARSLSALFLFDQSGSLDGSDPNGIRYDGLKVALQSLSRVSRPDGEPVAIEVAVSAFDDNYYKARNVVEWTRINQGNDDDVAESIDEVIEKAKDRTRPDGGTNFTAAMEGANDDLKDRGSRGTCRVVFWFTDGADNVDTVGNDPCRVDSGLIDQMRKDGIVIVGLQLGPPTDDLRAISTGSSPSVSCGRNPVPSDWAGGVYIQADDSAALRRLFGTLGNIVNGCAPQGDRGGLVDPGVRAMNVTIYTPDQVDTVRLDAPDGTVITAASRGSTTQGGYTTLAQSDETYVSLTVEFPPGEGAGQWTVSAGQAVTPDDMEFCVFSGLHLVRADPKASPNAGGEGEVVYQAVDAEGNVADLSVYEDVAVGAGVVASNGDVRQATAERVGDQIVVRFRSEPTDARLQVRLTAQLTTVSGVALTPLAVDEGLGLTLSQAFPTISPIEELDLGAAINEQPASADLTLVGSPLGPTQVCFDKATQILVPEDVAGTTLDVVKGCVDLAQSESKKITVSVTPLKPTVGNGEAILPVRLLPVAGSEMDGLEAEVNLPVLWRFENPRDPVVLVAVLVLACLLSVGLPLLALGLANLLTARYHVNGLRGEAIPITITDDGPTRTAPLEGAPNGIIDYRMPLIPVSNRKKFRFGSLEFSAKASMSPLKAPAFLVRPLAGGDRVVSSVLPQAPDGAYAGAIPGLGFLAVVLVTEAELAGDPDQGIGAQLVVLVRDDLTSATQLDDLLRNKIDWQLISRTWAHAAGRSAASDTHLGARTALSDFPEETDSGGGSWGFLDD